MTSGTGFMNVPLVLLPIFVTIYIIGHDFRSFSLDARFIVKNSTHVPSSIIPPDLSPFSSQAAATISNSVNNDHADQVVTEGVLNLSQSGQDHQSSSSHQEELEEGEQLVTSSDAADENATMVTIKTQNETDTTPPTCCFGTLVHVESRMTAEYFENQRTTHVDPKMNWTGTEYEEWLLISERLNPNHEENYTNLDCATQYSYLVLEQVYGYYLRLALTDLGHGHLNTFPYYEEKPGLPRILLLGDSISLGIRVQTQQLYQNQATIQGAPMNCLGFSKYETALQDWLGSCSWDLVQFNVGMHYHPKIRGNSTAWHKEYVKDITNIVNTIRAHSPSARIVFALTTPSPFDSKATTPQKSTCPHYSKFHKAGLVPAMNKVAISIANQLNMMINDRYSLIQPVLQQYQLPCDIHYSEEGYRYMAQNDWNIFSIALAMENDPHR